MPEEEVLVMPSKSRPSPEYLERLRQRYAAAKRKTRSAILDEFVQTSGYHRKHAIALLGSKYVYRTGPVSRPRARTYIGEDRQAVQWLADLFDQIGSRRLRAAMDANLADLREQGNLVVSAACFARLQVISPATLDRLRASAHVLGKRGRGYTKPGTLLKRQIPIRTYAEWDQTRPGFLEIDLVDHSGGIIGGESAWTLNCTDVASGWTEMVALPGKAQKYVFAALQLVRARLPVPLLGIDSDNGAEFINHQLLRYCQQEQITFTRGRVGRKNDNPFVEQKNWSVVRRLVGYLRYDQPEQVAALNRLFERYRLYINHYLPVEKLREKVRDGSHVRRMFDPPQTPYARVLAAALVTDSDKQALCQQHASLDVVLLKQQIDDLYESILPTPLGKILS
jgi:hypothetical protein